MSFFSNLFHKKQPDLKDLDLSVFKTDIHSHLIPGIDDGAQNMDESIAMLAKFESLGYKKVVTTPHIMSDYFKNDSNTILNGLSRLNEVKDKLNLKIEVDAAAEYYYDETLLERLNNNEKLLTFGDNYVLFEFSFHTEPPEPEKLFFELLTKGYKPVLAHFERYLFLKGNIDRVFKWREKGVNIQLNLNSLTGHYGPQIKQQARALIDAEQVDFVGTDCHRMDHLLLLEKNLKSPYLHKLAALPLKNQEL